MSNPLVTTSSTKILIHTYEADYNKNPLLEGTFSFCNLIELVHHHEFQVQDHQLQTLNVFQRQFIGPNL